MWHQVGVWCNWCSIFSTSIHNGLSIAMLDYRRVDMILVGGLEDRTYFSIQLGMSPSQLTNSNLFQRGRAQPPTSHRSSTIIHDCALLCTIAIYYYLYHPLSTSLLIIYWLSIYILNILHRFLLLPRGEPWWIIYYYYHLSSIIIYHHLSSSIIINYHQL